MSEEVKVEVEDKEEKKKGGKVKKFFLFVLLAAAAAAVVKFFKGRQADYDDNEWQELPPPQGG